MLRVAREFFQLPEDERLKYYSEDPSKSTRLSTSFNVKTEKVSNWRDFLRLHCYPLEDFMHEWPSNPPCFRCVTYNYCFQTQLFDFQTPIYACVLCTSRVHAYHMLGMAGAGTSWVSTRDMQGHWL